jgi:DNA-binding NtrC family response regulator
MVVDDEPDIVKMVEMYLKAWNFEVDGFTDPVKALAHFRQGPAFFSLVLTDIRMPGMSGVELAQQIIETRPETKIMLMTAYDIPPIKMEDGLPIVKYEDILKKPFRLADICQGVKKQLQIAYSLKEHYWLSTNV